ncbi:hypothetical protein BJ165DRAFT_1407682 [Panaeolus papilionaceus]|nr:hypothetical protein BJ165DRAFT_1407682 [Panaeolus papilionaceus]
MHLSILCVLTFAIGSAVAHFTFTKPERCDIPKLRMFHKITELAPAPYSATFVLLGVGYQNYTCSAEGKYTNEFDAVEDKAYNQWLKAKGPKFDPEGCNNNVPFVGYHFFQKTTAGGTAPVWDLRKYMNKPKAYVVGAPVAGISAPDCKNNIEEWLQIEGIEGSLAGLIYRTDVALRTVYPMKPAP